MSHPDWSQHSTYQSGHRAERSQAYHNGEYGGDSYSYSVNRGGHGLSSFQTFPGGSDTFPSSYSQPSRTISDHSPPHHSYPLAGAGTYPYTYHTGASTHPTTSNYFNSVDHSIDPIHVSESQLQNYIREPNRREQQSPGWKPGYMKCVFPDCPSPAVDVKAIRPHLAAHLNNKKAYVCRCGTKFGRWSEAKRHLDDQSPCDQCGDPRRKQRGTKTCSRCYGPGTNGGSGSDFTR